MALWVVAEEYLKTRLWLLLAIACWLLVHKINAASSIKNQSAEPQEPLAESRNVF